jgi:hypothetical protein
VDWQNKVADYNQSCGGRKITSYTEHVGGHRGVLAITNVAGVNYLALHMVIAVGVKSNGVWCSIVRFSGSVA